jgi:hypothetical protein
VVFALLGAAMLATLGLIAGLWADKFDQMAAFQNFIIVPMTFLSGVFYSIQSLPPFWQTVSHLNPFFYMIDGFRYGFFGQRHFALAQPGHRGHCWLAVSAILPCTCCASATKFGTDMTADQLKDIIAAGLALRTHHAGGRRPPLVCHHRLGRVRGQAPFSATSACMPRWAPNADDEVHALSMKTFTPAEWATQRSE